MSKKEFKKRNIEEVVIEPVEEAIEPVEEAIVEVAEESIEEPEVAPALEVGVIVKCSHLNLRNAPNKDSDVIIIVDSGSKLSIDLSESNDTWYKVIASDGTKGYCMRNYIEISR